MRPSGRGASVAEIIAFADDLLDAEAFDDHGPNGLQVPGPPRVERIATCVSAHLESIGRAREAGAGLLLAHHGILWRSQGPRITPAQAERLKALFAGPLALAQYHLPLDAHGEIGNNALLADGLGAAGHEPAFVHGGRPIGVVARFADGIEPGELVARVERLTGRAPLVFDAGPGRVSTLGIVSGGGASDVLEAVSLGLDAFLTGEPTEHVMADAIEGGVHFIAAGHYATETFGIRRLGETIAARFELEHEFIDVPNPI